LIKAQIKSVDNGNSLKIDEEGAIGAIVHPHPPWVEVIDVLPFRQYFTDTGVMTGSNDMTVNGSSTSVDFYISASNDYDIYIKYISAEIGDGGSPSLNDFGS